MAISVNKISLEDDVLVYEISRNIIDTSTIVVKLNDSVFTDFTINDYKLTLDESQSGILSIEGNTASATSFSGGDGGEVLTEDNDEYNTGVGIGVFENIDGTAKYNVGIGFNSLNSLTKGDYNIGIGFNSLLNVTTSNCNTAIGYKSLLNVTTGTSNIGIGCNSLLNVTTGYYNLGLGYNSSINITTGEHNISLGYKSNNSIESSDYNIAIGKETNYCCKDGVDNIAIGQSSLYNNTASDIISIGKESGYNNEDANYNVYIGSRSSLKNKSGEKNTTVGYYSGYNNLLNDNTLIGYYAGSNVNSDNNTCLGSYADFGDDDDKFVNCTMLGYQSTVTGDDQVQLGNSDTTTYAYGAVQDRSDKRDKTDIIINPLGLEFINKIEPVQFKWDFREDYYNIVDKEITRKKIEIDKDGNEIEVEVKETIQVKEFYEKDGSKKRNRPHNGVIAQQVKEVMDEMNVDFAGYHDASINGGKDVLSIGYEEFISPLIKAVQELTKKVERLERKLERKNKK
jgi:hypothetical protein